MLHVDVDRADAFVSLSSLYGNRICLNKGNRGELCCIGVDRVTLCRGNRQNRIDRVQ